MLSNHLARYQTVDTLLQYFLLVPFTDKQAYFIYLVHSLAGNSMIVFTRTKSEAQMSVQFRRFFDRPKINRNTGSQSYFEY